MHIVELFDGFAARPSCFLGEKHPCSVEEAYTAHGGWRLVCKASRRNRRSCELANSESIAASGIM
ncbi:MAG: hypothetical protein ACYC3X_22190 [Pirellulaceae bacterium]